METSSSGKGDKYHEGTGRGIDLYNSVKTMDAAFNSKESNFELINKIIQFATDAIKEIGTSDPAIVSELNLIIKKYKNMLPPLAKEVGDRMLNDLIVKNNWQKNKKIIYFLRILGAVVFVGGYLFTLYISSKPPKQNTTISENSSNSFLYILNNFSFYHNETVNNNQDKSHQAIPFDNPQYYSELKNEYTESMQIPPKQSKTITVKKLEETKLYYFYIGHYSPKWEKDNWESQNVQEDLSQYNSPLEFEGKIFTTNSIAVFYGLKPNSQTSINECLPKVFNGVYKLKVINTSILPDKHDSSRSHIWSQIQIINQ
jgi:hypothetical protein